jgi:hypothetical protein
VLQVYERKVHWLVLREGAYQPLSPDETGVLKSELFPGLWLQPEALWKNDMATLLAVLQQGLASPEHAEFVSRLRTTESPRCPCVLTHCQRYARPFRQRPARVRHNGIEWIVTQHNRWKRP